MSVKHTMNNSSMQIIPRKHFRFKILLYLFPGQQGSYRMLFGWFSLFVELILNLTFFIWLRFFENLYNEQVFFFKNLRGVIPFVSLALMPRSMSISKILMSGICWQKNMIPWKYTFLYFAWSSNLNSSIWILYLFTGI